MDNFYRSPSLKQILKIHATGYTWQRCKDAFSSSAVLCRNKVKVKKTIDWAKKAQEVDSTSEEVTFTRQYMAEKIAKRHRLAPETEQAVYPRPFGHLRFDKYNAAMYYPDESDNFRRTHSYGM